MMSTRIGCRKTATIGRVLYVALASVPVVLGSDNCRAIPGDPDWPSKAAWDKLNTTVSGRLIATVPVAHVCHDPDYNAAACIALKNEWSFGQPYLDSPSDVMFPLMQNQSCDPYTDRSVPCTLGNYPAYSINVTSVEDVQAGVRFARENNVRLVIKNTGHDLLGKSAGKGSLSLWTHHLDAITVHTNYTSTPNLYTGPAITLGPGVVAYQALAAANAHGLRMLTSLCTTVGIAGGYTLGGGYGALSSIFGLSADNVLEWEVVTADGEHRILTPPGTWGRSNDNDDADLFWALSGGGGSTFAVVISVTLRAYQDSPVAGGSLSFNDSAVGSDTFWGAVGLFYEETAALVDAGGATFAALQAGSLSTAGLVVPMMTTGEEVTALLKPLLDGLKTLGVPYSWTPTQWDSYYDYWVESWGPLPYGPYPVTEVIGGRLIPRASVENSTQRQAVMGAMKETVANGDFYLGCAIVHPSLEGKGMYPDNAVLPAWRDAIANCIVVGVWDWNIPFEEMAARGSEVTNVYMPALDEATPGSGIYLNEGDVNQPDWQVQFYGENWERLSAVKSKYDPEGVFYAKTAVGSEAWEADTDGRLCFIGEGK